MSGRVSYLGGIVKDGLVLDLDAGKLDSYNRLGTTWNDVSGNGNNGTLTNFSSPSPQTIWNSNNGGSILFDGVDDYVSISDINFTTTTIDIWVYVNAYAIAGQGTVFIYQLGNGFEIWSNNVGLIRYNKNSTTTLTSGSGFSLNTWNNIVATSNGTTNTLYLNGVSIGSNAGGIFDNTSGDIRISGYGGYYLNGRCPLLKMYNRGLTISEVLQNYNATKGRYL